MSDDSMPQDLLIRVLIQAEKLNAVVVGGQALNFWGEYYLSSGVDELAEMMPFQSKDIDFFGAASEAKALAEYLDSDLQLPSADDHVTPSSAVIVIATNQKNYQIDFLRSMAGLDSEEVVSRAQELTIYDPEHGEDVTVRLIHPADVLKSRIAGLTLLRRSDDIAIRQMKAAPIILREFIRELLNSGEREDVFDAQGLVVEMIRVGSSEMNDTIMSEHKIDILSYALELATHPSWHPKFAEFQIRQACGKKIEKRDRRIAEVKRRTDGLGAQDGSPQPWD